MKSVRRFGGLAVSAGTVVGLIAYPPDRLTAQDSLPARPPTAAPLKPVQFPPFYEATLPNGLTLVVVEHHEQPTVSVGFTFQAGAAHDPAGKDGLAEIVAEVLTKGTPSRTAEQIAAGIEGVGGTLAASADRDFLTVSSGALSDHVEFVFELLADVIRRATFPETELELARTRMLSNLQIQLSTPEGLAERFFARELYGPHPYGRRPSAESYRAIVQADLRAFAGARLMPRGALLVVAGDVTPARVRALVDRNFASWTGAPPVAAPPPAAPVRQRRDILLVHRPGSVQANIVAGNTTFPPTDPVLYATRLATQVLGGGPDSRLFLILREGKGWTYGAYAGLERYRGLGHWQATFEGRTEVADSALAELLRQIDRIRTEAIPDSELVNAKGFLVGSFPLTIETPSQIAQQVGTAKRLGLGNDYVRLYRERLSAVTAVQARAAAQRVYRPSALSIVVVGNAEQLHPKLTPIAPVRLVDADGKPLTLADLRPKAAPLAFDRAQLVERTDSFRVLVQGNPFGTSTSRLTIGGDSLVFSEHTVLGALINQRSTVVLDGATLAMRRTDQTGTVQGQATETHLVYSAGRVKGRTQTPQATGTPKTLEVDTTVAAGTIDDNALNFILPALLLADGQAVTVNVFSSNEGVSKPMTAKVAGTDSVTVPAGMYVAYRVEIAGGQVPVVMHVSRDTPRRVVKIALVGPPIVYELVK